jgi:TonB family protein
MIKLFPATGGAALLVAAGSPQAVAPPPQAPVKKWVVDFAEQQCMASRDYGSPDKPLMLVLKPSPLGNVLQLTVVRKIRGSDTVEVPSEVTIGNSPALKLDALAFNLPRAKLRALRINLPLEMLQELARSSTLSVTTRGEMDASFALSGMPALTSAIGSCLADLQSYWNAGPANEGKLKERASANLAQYFKDEDYPGLAVMKQQGGSVQFALLVDPAGKVADCVVTESSKVPVLDAQSCNVLLERAKFTPAVSLDGKPARDSVVGRVTWRMR